MELVKLLYISRSTIAAGEEADSVNDIVRVARSRNPAMEITGALLFTGEHFAQVLEGERAAIDALMADIRADSRHEQINVVHHGALAARRFSDWNLAYFGPSQFVSRHVTRLFNDPSPRERRRAAEWLDELLWEFSAGPAARV